MSQSHAPSIHREPAGSGAVPRVGPLRVVLLSPGVYALSETGASAGAAVNHGSGNFAITDTTTVGDANFARIGPAMGVMY